MCAIPHGLSTRRILITVIRLICPFQNIVNGTVSSPIRLVLADSVLPSALSSTQFLRFMLSEETIKSVSFI